MTWNDPIDDETWQAIRRQAHEAITRALTAQAWAVACAVFNDNGEPINDDEMPHYAYVLTADVAALPAPADLAAEILGK